MNILLKIYCMPVILKNLRSHHVLLVCFLLAFSSQSIAKPHVGFNGTCRLRFHPPPGTNLVEETTAKMAKLVEKNSAWSGNTCISLIFFSTKYSKILIINVFWTVFWNMCFQMTNMWIKKKKWKKYKYITLAVVSESHPVEHLYASELMPSIKFGSCTIWILNGHKLFYIIWIFTQTL